MELKTMHLNRLHNMEHFQFAGHVIAMCEESAIEKIKAVLEPLKTAVAEEDKALNLPRKQEGTADLEELDRVRDQAYRALQLLIEMHSCSDDATKPSTPSSAAWTRWTTLSQRPKNCPNSSSYTTPWSTNIA